MPILTRLFAPEAFGIAALFTSITLVIGVVACLRYELSVMLPKTDEEAVNLLGVSVLFALVTTAVTGLIIFLFGNSITALLNAPRLKQYLWLIPVAVLANGLFLAFNCWNSRTKHFGRLSIARVVRSVTMQATKMGAGFAGFVSGGTLIAGDMLGWLVSTSVLGAQIWRNDRRLFRTKIRWTKMIAGLRRYKKFPIYSTWSALLNTASHQLPALILAVYFSPKIVGYFFLGRAALSLPINMVGMSVAQVFFEKAANVHSHNGDLSKVVDEVFQRLVLLGIFPLLLLTLIGQEVFSVVFGSRWAEAGFYVQILALSIFFQFISSPISTLYIVFEKQGFGLAFDILLFFTRAVSLIIGGVSGKITFALLLFSASGIVCYGFLCCWLSSSSGLHVFRVFSIIVRYGRYCMPLLIAVAIIKWFFRANEIAILLIGLSCTVLYYFLVLKHDNKLMEVAQALLQKYLFIK